MSGKLYVVGTPIGNLEDISFRALEILKSVDFIAAEDTRVTSKLLNHFQIRKPLISYFEHNKIEKGKIICNKILSGEVCALVTDAGMPAISDPGEDLVRQCHENSIDIKVIPGPSAAISALSLSGMPSGRFTFEGFLSRNKKSRINHLNSLKNEHRTMIFYESPHKIVHTLRDFLDFFGDVTIFIARELTKIYEEIKILKISEAIDLYSRGARGEFVVILPGVRGVEPEIKYSFTDAVDFAALCVKNGDPCSEAAKKASHKTGIPRSEIYKFITRN